MAFPRPFISKLAVSTFGAKSRLLVRTPSKPHATLLDMGQLSVSRTPGIINSENGRRTQSY